MGDARFGMADPVSRPLRPVFVGELQPPPPQKSSVGKLALALLCAVAVMLWAYVVFADGAASQPAAGLPPDWHTQLLELAGAALMAGLTYALSALKAYFTAHAKGTLGNYALGVYSRLDDAVTTAVQAVEQQTQRDMAAGFTKPSAERAKADAIAYVKAYMGPKGLAELANIVGLDQVAAVLSGKIESAVLSVNQKGAADPVLPAGGAAK